MNSTLSLPDYCDVEKPNMFMALAPERPASPICGSDNDSDDDRFEVVRRSLKLEKRKGNSNFEEFYFTRVEDAMKKIIDDSKSKVTAENNEVLEETFKSPESSLTKLQKRSFMKRWKFI